MHSHPSNLPWLVQGRQRQEQGSLLGFWVPGLDWPPGCSLQPSRWSTLFQGRAAQCWQLPHRTEAFHVEKSDGPGRESLSKAVPAWTRLPQVTCPEQVVKQHLTQSLPATGAGDPTQRPASVRARKSASHCRPARTQAAAPGWPRPMVSRSLLGAWRGK